MANVLGTLFSDIANAIRSKTGSSEKMSPKDFPSQIGSIEVGSGGLDIEAINVKLNEINGEAIGEIIVESGACGTTVNYTLKDSGELIIAGTGAITSAPWLTNEQNLTLIKEVKILEGVTEICESAFYNCVSIESIIMADTVTRINESTFWHCDNLTDIVLSNNLERINLYAFGWCINLKSIKIPASVSDILYYAFARCDNLTSVIFENVTGWYSYKTSAGYTGDKFDPADLENPNTAATFLTDTYEEHWWRNDH